MSNTVIILLYTFQLLSHFQAAVWKRFSQIAVPMEIYYVTTLYLSPPSVTFSDDKGRSLFPSFERNFFPSGPAGPSCSVKSKCLHGPSPCIIKSSVVGDDAHIVPLDDDGCGDARVDEGIDPYEVLHKTVVLALPMPPHYLYSIGSLCDKPLRSCLNICAFCQSKISWHSKAFAPDRVTFLTFCTEMLFCHFALHFFLSSGISFFV